MKDACVSRYPSLKAQNAKDFYGKQRTGAPQLGGSLSFSGYCLVLFLKVLWISTPGVST
jgi:hypothetical protein